MLSGRSAPSGTRHRQATIGITLGAVSLAFFLTVCFIYFVVLGYPLPHIGRYHPPAHRDQACVC
jgi:hypothetical protein